MKIEMRCPNGHREIIEDSRTRKLSEEGKIRIVNRVDRYQYYPILEKNLEAARNE